MKPFIAPTEDFVKSEKSELAGALASGSSKAVDFKNADRFSANDYVIVGEEGKEQTEICQISSISGNEITFANVVFSHEEGEPVTKIAYNQRKFYGCATKDGTYSLIDTKDIEVDNPQGTYFEYTGSTYNYFKATYYNSQTSTETSKDDATASQAGDVEHYCSIYDIREEAGFLNNEYISDGRINSLRLKAESEVKGSIASKYSLPLDEVPEVVALATKLLSAGWLMYQEYGSDMSGTNKDGIERVKEGRRLLKDIREGKIILLDSDDSELTRKSSFGVEGYPDDTAEDQLPSEGKVEVHTRMSDKF